MAKKKASSSVRRTKTASKKKIVRKASKTTTRRKRVVRKKVSGSATDLESKSPDGPVSDGCGADRNAEPTIAAPSESAPAKRSPPPARRKVVSRRRPVGGVTTEFSDSVPGSEAGSEAHDSEPARSKSRRSDSDRSNAAHRSPSSGGGGRERRNDGDERELSHKRRVSRRSRRPGPDSKIEGDERPNEEVAPPPKPVVKKPSLSELKPPTPLRVMGKGSTPPFVVARGEESLRVLDESLNYTGFFERLEEVLALSKKPREAFEIVAKVDLLHAEGREEYPVSYTDPRLVKHVFDQLLDRGFRLLRVVDTRNELSRYQRNRGVKQVGKAVGYDESCYDLRDLGDELYPVELPGALGKATTGRTWLEADFRMVIAKNRTDEVMGPALLFYNLFSTMAVPTSLISLERGMEPANFVYAMMEALPVHFSIIDAVYSRDGSPGVGGPFELLQDAEGEVPQGAELLRTDTIFAGSDFLAVEAAGQKMQGVDPMEDPVFKQLRKTTGYKMPAEIADLPMHAGWLQLGQQLREILDTGRAGEAARCAVNQRIQVLDKRLFPNLPGGWQHIRLGRQVEKYLQEIRAVQSGEEIALADGPPAWSSDGI